MKTILLIVVGVAVLLGILFVAKEEVQAPNKDVEQNTTEKQQQTTATSMTPASYVSVYDGINVPNTATTLDLSGKGLSGSLKAEVRLLTKLKSLDLSNNNFTGLPAEVGQLSELEVLNLSNNPLTGLPQELGNLGNLHVLDLRGTQYSEFDLNKIKEGLPASVEIKVD